MNLLTIPQIAERLRCHEDTVRKLINERELPALRVGRYLVDEADLESWVQKQKPQPTRIRATRNVRQLPEKRATRIERLKALEEVSYSQSRVFLPNGGNDAA